MQTNYDKQAQIVQNTDIYQKGNRLNRLSDTVYRYDEAGRVISRTKHPNQRHERHETFVWNGFNQLITFNDKAQHQWHYKYDGLGRRVEKYSERDNTTTKYIWDGDQLALTLTFKQDKLIHQRHSVFHGWELLAQQDSDQDKQTTHYAVSQPNGKILGLFTPEGELAWKAEKRTLWGICFDWYQFKYPNPLDPEMLFAGQWLDQESGLAYNRFRYYDPETGNYLCLDPIGLAGGETPYSYVFNPIDWLDPLGLTKTPTYILKKLWKNETGVNPSRHVHHRLPEQFSDKFQKLGNLDVNNPRYFYDLTPDKHIKKPNGIHTNTSPLGQEWNKHWEGWLNRNETRLQNLGKERAGKVIEKHLSNIAKRSRISDYNSLSIKKCKR